MSKALEILKTYWGYPSFRVPQEAIIQAVLSEQNVFAVLPTGAGKSICYQIPGLILPGVTIVISPLVALMKDQVDQLKRRNISAITLPASQTQSDIVQQFDNLKYGSYKFLYISPERLQSEFIQNQLQSLTVSLIAVDEAHCISEWGHDFRPSYRKIATLRELHPKAKLIATTATATQKVIDDIVENLKLESSKQFKSSLRRPELTFHIKQTQDLRNEIKKLVIKQQKPSIVYTTSRKASKALSDYLNHFQLASGFYHGGRTAKDKQKAYENWLSEKTPTMVATNAFGMGIDKDNVGLIIHANIPYSLENFLQETGRAGRDGQTAFAYLLYNEATITAFKAQTDAAIINIKELKQVYIKINQYYQIAPGECPDVSFDFDFTEFCESYGFELAKTFHVLRVLEQEGIIHLSENSYRKSTLKITCTQEQLFHYLNTRKRVNKLLSTLLRTYGGLFDHHTAIDEFLVSKRVAFSKAQVVNMLTTVHHDRIADYRQVKGKQSIRFLVPREDTAAINVLARHIKQRNAVKLEKQMAMLDFVKNTTHCRTKLLLAYFEENMSQDCGSCDICEQKKSQLSQKDQSVVAQNILEILKGTSMSSQDLLASLQADKATVIETLQLLLEKNKISLTSQNKFEVN